MRFQVVKEFQMSTTILLTIPEAAEECRMSEGYIKTAIRNRELEARKFGKNTRIERTELERWIKAKPVKIVVTMADQGQSPANPAPNQMVEKTVGARS